MSLLKLRFDVDYAYHSRLKSYLHMQGFDMSIWNYLNEAKNLTMLINNSDVDVKAYWFFTPFTLPDRQLLYLLEPEKHEVGLHIIKNPDKELRLLESKVQRPIRFYTVHGTNSLLGQIVWGRGIGEKQIVVQEKFELYSFHSELTHSLDRACFGVDCETAYLDAVERVNRGFVLAAHPEWLFASNGKDRGPYYNVLFKLLKLSTILETKKSEANL